MIFAIPSSLDRADKISPRTFIELNIWERKHLEEWIRLNPEMLGEDLLILTVEFDRFVQSSDRLDLLALDRSGNLVVIELKRDSAAGYADLQAIRYAAMVSSMTVDRLLPYYVAYRKRYFAEQLSEVDARSQIVEFVGSESFVEFSTKPRIILCSEGFSQEITTTILWLRSWQIDISCVKITPYKMGDQIVIVPKTVLPLEEARQYTIDIKIKEEEREQSIRSSRPKNSKTMKLLVENGLIKAGDPIYLKNALPPYFRYEESDPTFQATIMPAPLSWSADGKLVAATSWWRKDGYRTAIRCYPPEGGTAIILPFRSHVSQALWLHNESGFLSSIAPARTKNTRRQIWQQPYPQAEPRRITNDLGDYYDLSLTADDKLLTAVQRELTSAVFLAPSSDPDRGVPITTATADGLDVSWMPHGKLLLEDTKYRFSEAEADGRNRVSLFTDEEGYGGVSICGDGRFIVFNSSRQFNRLKIWRVDSDGHNLKPLTQGQTSDDFFPDCSPDGASVIYASRLSDGMHLMKISVEGGMPEILVKGPAGAGRYSPDGKQIAFYGANGITIISSVGGAPLKTFDLAPGGNLGYWDFSMLHWAPDGQALTYPLLAGDEMNLWSQPVSGGPPRQLTHFHDRILAYDWSPDGKRLAITRAKYSTDVVMIRNFR